ncbi:MAG: EF-hand domain-containing protein [Planctomycetota bacterium]|nr:EF-hand domain-containing protein [Planctomycetota bacterium]
MKFVSLATFGVAALATLAIAQRPGRPAPTPPPPAAPTQPPPNPVGPSAPPEQPNPAPAGRSPKRPEERPAPRASSPRSVLPGDEVPADLPGPYFRTCDYDGNGWISFSEAKASMNVDRKAFAVYDTDSDGRISLEEYTGRYLTIVTRGGAFAPPIDKVVSRRIPKRTADELLAAFDTDNDGVLDVRDVQRALAEYGAQGVDAAKVLDSIDDDKSGRVEAPEAQALLDVLVPPSLSIARKKIGSIEALFDTVETRKVDIDTTPQPARLRGPVSTFRRLDFDRSGDIGLDDLDQLQRPLLIPIRASAVIATLDIDGDGVLSPAEFAASMR